MTGLYERVSDFLLEAYGPQNLNPRKTYDFRIQSCRKKLKRLIEEDIPVILCSQCLYGESDFSVYEGGLNVLKTGALQGRKMTKESIYAKLRFALSTGKGVEHVRKVFETIIWENLIKNGEFRNVLFCK